MNIRSTLKNTMDNPWASAVLDLAVTSFLLRLGCSAAIAVSAGLALSGGTRIMLRLPSRQAEPSIGRCAVALGALGILIGSLRLGVFDLVGTGQPTVAVLLTVLSSAAVCQLTLISAWTWINDARPITALPTTVAFGLTACAFALRGVYGAQVELLPEETYYWNYAQHLDFSYLDHPPMVAWLIAAGTAVFGPSEFGVRVGAMLCSAIASLAIYRTALNTVRAPEARYALLLAQWLPFMFLSGFLITPDAPLAAAWAVAVYFLERALVAGQARAWWAVGIAIGLGLLSKYTIALLGVGTVVYLISEPRARYWLYRIEPYGAAAIALLIFSPVIYWNAEHEWASFTFQTMQRLAERPRFALPALIGGVLVVITPIGAFAAVRLLLRRGAAAACTEYPESGRLLKTLTWVPLAVFALFSLRHTVKLDWTGAPWIAALPLLACSVGGARRAMAGLSDRLAGRWPGMLIGLIVLYPLLFCYLVGRFPGVSYGTHAELVPVGWRELGRQVQVLSEAERTTSGQPPLVIGMDRYATASELAYYTHPRPDAVANTSSAHLFGGMGLMYERWFPIAKQEGRSLLLISWRKDTLEQLNVAATATTLTPIMQGTISREGRLVHRYYYRILRGYRPPAPH